MSTYPGTEASAPAGLLVSMILLVSVCGPPRPATSILRPRVPPQLIARDPKVDRSHCRIDWAWRCPARTGDRMLVRPEQPQGQGALKAPCPLARLCRGLAVGHDPRPLHANGAEVLVCGDAELHPAPASPELSAAARFHRVDGEPPDVPLAIASKRAAMALPPGACLATEPRALRRNRGVDVTRRALLDRHPQVGADLARVARMDLRHVTADVHWTDYGRVTERERIVLSACRRRAYKSHRRNGGDRKETSQLSSLRGQGAHATPDPEND